MPDTSTTATTGQPMLTAGIVFKIGDTVIPNLLSTPDMLFSREKVDVTTFDNKKRKAYIGGLEDTDELNFDFIDIGTNYTAALQNQRTPGTKYTVTYPDGTVITITGDHATGKLSASQNDALKFRVAITATDIDDGSGS